MRFQISASSSQLNGTFSVAGVDCTYSGRLSDSYTGTMDCPDRQAVRFKLWLIAARQPRQQRFSFGLQVRCGFLSDVNLGLVVQFFCSPAARH
jgi:hypothetical protein